MRWTVLNRPPHGLSGTLVVGTHLYRPYRQVLRGFSNSSRPDPPHDWRHWQFWRNETGRWWEMLKAYRYGVIGGIGAASSLGALGYFFYPHFRRTGNKTAAQVLTSAEVYQKASDLTKNLTEELLRDEGTALMVTALLLQILRSSVVRQDTAILVQSLMNDADMQEATRRFLLTVLQEPQVEAAVTDLLSRSIQQVLAQQSVQRAGGKALKGAFWSCWW